MSGLSDYLQAHIPPDWTRRDVVRAVGDALDQATVYRYLKGEHTASPPERVLQAFARALPSTTIVELREAAGLAAGEPELWTLPPEAQRLSRAQRAVIEQLIRVFLSPLELEQEEHNAEDSAGSGDAQAREYLRQLRATGQDELADRLEASLVISSASQTASRCSKT